MATIFVKVSDGEMQEFLVNQLSWLYDLSTATSLHAILSGTEAESIDLCVVDQQGLEQEPAISRYRAPEGSTAQVPILLVVPQDEAWQLRDAWEPLIDEVLRVPAPKWEVRKRVQELVDRSASKRISSERLRVWERHSDFLLKRVQCQNEQLRQAFVETVMSLARAAEFKDRETGRHLRRVSYYCRAIAAELGLDELFQDRIFYASPLHDIGKIGIPDALLLKAGPLTNQEWPVMRSHSTIGAKILRNADSPYLQMGEEIASFHHEHWDGSGYPCGLTGEAIPLPARIMKLVDVYDALRSQRPYKTAMEHSEAVRIIYEGDLKTSPENFDPLVLAAFSRRQAEFDDIFNNVD